MMLCLDGSDIRRLAFAMYEWRDQASEAHGWRQTREGVIEAPPEQWLAQLAALGVAPQKIDGVVAVQGPGSATALRTSLAMANTLAMARQIPLFGVRRGTPWEQVMTFDGPKGGVAYLEPLYEHEARITPSNKDNLRR